MGCSAVAFLDVSYLVYQYSAETRHEIFPRRGRDTEIAVGSGVPIHLTDSLAFPFLVFISHRLLEGSDGLQTIYHSIVYAALWEILTVGLGQL